MTNPDPDFDLLVVIVSVALCKPAHGEDPAWRRRQADSAIATTRRYDGDPSPEALALVERWVASEVGVEALKEALGRPLKPRRPPRL